MSLRTRSEDRRTAPRFRPLGRAIQDGQFTRDLELVAQVEGARASRESSTEKLRKQSVELVVTAEETLRAAFSSLAEEYGHSPLWVDREVSRGLRGIAESFSGIPDNERIMAPFRERAAALETHDE